MPMIALNAPTTATFIGRHPLLAFFSLAYGERFIIRALPYIGPFAGPSLAAFLITGWLAGKEGTHALRRRYRLWRVGSRWYLVPFLLIPAFVVIGALTLPGAAASYTGATRGRLGARVGRH